MTPYAKLAFVGGCFVIALLSVARAHDRRDWFWLVAGLGFTFAADYFLVLRDSHLTGVAVFCFVHICYILRVNGVSAARGWKNSPSPFRGEGEEYTSYRARIFFAFAAAWTVAAIIGSVAVFAGLYALVFAANIFVNVKARRPKLNYRLVLAGLILFALCDVNVMLANLPAYAGLPNYFPRSAGLIWLFYLPSQALLAVSAISPFPRHGLSR